MIASGPKRSTGLSSYHGRKISVLFSQYAGLSAPPSSAVYDIDPQLGNVLKILIEDEGDLPTELLISESEWSGLVVADLRDDCDYCFLPASTSVPSQAWES